MSTLPVEAALHVRTAAFGVRTLQEWGVKMLQRAPSWGAAEGVLLYVIKDKNKNHNYWNTMSVIPVLFLNQCNKMEQTADVKGNWQT